MIPFNIGHRRCPRQCLHPEILASLWEQKCTPNIYSMEKDFLQDRNAHIQLGEPISSKRVTRRCLQGSVSGPKLQNIIISDLIVILSTIPKLKIVAFADDIMIKIQGPSHSAVLTTVVNTLRITEDLCKKYRLEISKDKSALMPMFIRNRDTYKSQPEISLWGLNVVSKIKYSGGRLL